MLFVKGLNSAQHVERRSATRQPWAPDGSINPRMSGLLACQGDAGLAGPHNLMRRFLKTEAAMAPDGIDTDDR